MSAESFIEYCARLHAEADALDATSPKRAWRQRVRAMVWQAAAGRCVECTVECVPWGDGADRGTLDHRWPKSKGGGWNLENLQLMCRTCNTAKADALPQQLAKTKTKRVGRRPRRRFFKE